MALLVSSTIDNFFLPQWENTEMYYSIIADMGCIVCHLLLHPGKRAAK